MHQFIKSETPTTSAWYQHMDDTNSRCRMFKNQLESLLDKFEVCSKVTKSIRELTHFFAHRSFYADTSPTRGNSVAVYDLKN